MRPQGRGLPMFARIGAGSPSNDEVHAALDRVIASDVLQGSPQLIAFLRFVVEATLRGDGDQIKAYTIAVEALGRGENISVRQSARATSSMRNSEEK